MSGMIIGRDSVLDPLTEALHRSPGLESQWYYIRGQGGTGKSMVLAQVQEQARQVYADEKVVAQPICVQLDMQQIDLLFVEGLLDHLVTRLRAEFHTAGSTYFKEYDAAIYAFIQTQFQHPFAESRQPMLDHLFLAFAKGYEQIIRDHPVFILIDSMEIFDDYVQLLNQNGLRAFVEHKLLTLRGTTFVLAGQLHQHGRSFEPRTWHDPDRGIRPIFADADDAKDQVAESSMRVTFGTFTPAEIQSYLREYIPSDATWQPLLRNIPLAIQPRTDGGETELAAVLKHPLLLLLFKDRVLQFGNVDLTTLPDDRESLEFMLVQSYYELNGLSDVVMYMAIKDDRFDEYDLARIMAVKPRVARQKLKALRERHFVKALPDDTYRLHTAMRQLINEHVWEAFDKRHHQRDRLYKLLVERYQQQLIDIHRALKEKIQNLDRKLRLPDVDALARTLEQPALTLDQLLLPEYWPHGLPKPDENARQQVQLWIQRWTLEYQERYVVHKMRLMAQKLEFCANRDLQIDIFDREWYVMRLHQPEDIPMLVDRIIDELKQCELWLGDSDTSEIDQRRQLNFRVAYRKLRTLEYQRQYEMAASQYEHWMSRVAERDTVDDIERRILLMSRLAVTQIRQPDTSLRAGEATLNEALTLCQQNPQIEGTRARVIAKIAWLHHLTGDFSAAADYYKESIERLSTGVNEPRHQRNLFRWLTQWGYVQRYDNPYLGIELAEIAYMYLLRERHHVGVAQALLGLAALYRRSGSYNEAFRCALHAFTTAERAQRPDLEALALVELALTRWVAVTPIHGTDAERAYIEQLEIPQEQHANLNWTIQRLHEAQQRLQAHQDDAIMQSEYARLLHLLTHAQIAAGNAAAARENLKASYAVAERIDDQRRIQQALVTDLYLQVTFETTLSYDTFTQLPAYKLLIHQAENAGNFYGLGRAHHMAGQIAQRDAVAQNDDDLFERAITHYINAYAYLARQAGYGIINTGQDWCLFGDAVRDLEASSLPDVRCALVVRDWCNRLRTVLAQPAAVEIHASYPQIADLLAWIEARYNLLPDVDSPDADPYQQVDDRIVHHDFVGAWRIMRQHKAFRDPRLQLRQIEILTILERFDEARDRLHHLQSITKSTPDVLSEAEQQRMTIQIAVLLRAHIASPDSLLDNLNTAFDDLLTICERPVNDQVAAQASVYLAEALFNTGLYEAALRYYQRAARLYRRLQQPLWVGRCLFKISRLQSRMGHYGLAIWYADQGIALMDRWGYQPGKVEGHLVLGVAYRSWGAIASARGAPGTIQAHYQRARHYFSAAQRLAEDHNCHAIIPEIYKQQALTLRFESALMTGLPIAYERMLREALFYLDQAEEYYMRDARRAELTGKRRVSRHKRADLYQLRGHIWRSFSNITVDRNPSQWEQDRSRAQRAYETAIEQALDSNQFVIAAASALALVEMRYVMRWSHPRRTAEYNRLALDHSMYHYFRGNADPYFVRLNRLSEGLRNVSPAVRERLRLDDKADVPEGVLHYFGRVEIVLAYVALWENNHEAAVEKLTQAGLYFARSSRAVYNVKQMLRQLRRFLDDRDAIPFAMYRNLLHTWENDEMVRRVFPEGVVLCNAYQYIHRHGDEVDFSSMSVADFY